MAFNSIQRQHHHPLSSKNIVPNNIGSHRERKESCIKISPPPYKHYEQLIHHKPLDISRIIVSRPTRSGSRHQKGIIFLRSPGLDY